jgi:CRP-like cAMP-binding protein
MTSSLRNIYLFQRLSDARLHEVEAALKRRSLQPGEVLFEMGDPGDALIIVEEGEIAIYAPDDDHPGEEPPLRLFGPDEALGEMSLIDHQPRSLSARAAGGPAVVRLLALEDFRRFLAEDPDLAMAVMEGLSDRIRYTTDFLTEVREWVERVSAGDYEHTPDPNEASSYDDEALSTLAQDFATMATRVKQREERLKREIVKLQIEIDEQKRREEVETITNTDFFMDLKSKASEMREAMKDDDAAE